MKQTGLVQMFLGDNNLIMFSKPISNTMFPPERFFKINLIKTKEPFWGKHCITNKF